MHYSGTAKEAHSPKQQRYRIIVLINVIIFAEVISSICLRRIYLDGY